MPANAVMPLRPARRGPRKAGGSAPRCAPSCARARRSAARRRAAPANRRAAPAAQHGPGQRIGAAGLEQHAGLAVADEFLVPAHVAGHQQPALGHGLQRLERRDEFRQAHAVARVGQHVDQVVVALHLGVRHAAGEDDLVGHAELLCLRLQRRLLRPAAHQQHAQVGPLLQQRGQRGEQQVQPLVGVEAADETQHGGAVQAQAGLQRGVGRAAGFEVVDVDGVGDHRHLVGRDAARGDVAAQAFADGEHVRRLAQRVRLQPARQAVAQAAFGGGAVVDGGVFPEGAHFVDHRDAQALPTRSAGMALSTGECACRMCGWTASATSARRRSSCRISANSPRPGSRVPLSAGGVR